MAASAGGLKALSGVLAKLPVDFPAAVLIVQHLDPTHRSLMATNRRGKRIRCRVTCMPCAGVKENPVGVILLMVNADAAP